MRISTEIKKVALDRGICIKELRDERVRKVKNDIFKKYIQSRSGVFLWDHFKAPTVIADRDGWKKICAFIGDSSCLMFFDDIEDKSVMVISNGNQLCKLLGEMFGVQFYITNFETEYLICYNHHDCLLGCGTAKRWLESLK